jgi:hypothetical protein
VINDVSRQALVEVRSVLGVLRQVDETLTNSARALGGTLRAGPRPGGGSRGRAWLPLREQTP